MHGQLAQNQDKGRTCIGTSSFVSGASGDKHCLLSVTNGYWYHIHYTFYSQLKVKPVALLRDFMNISTEYMHLNPLKFVPQVGAIFQHVLNHMLCTTSYAIFIWFPFILFLNLYLSFILPEELN